MKNLFAFTLILALAAPLVGCSGGDDSVVGDSEVGKQGQSAAESTDPAIQQKAAGREQRRRGMAGPAGTGLK